MTGCTCDTGTKISNGTFLAPCNPCGGDDYDDGRRGILANIPNNLLDVVLSINPAFSTREIVEKKT